MSTQPKGTARSASPRRTQDKRAGELWARCPECHMPVKDAALFKHLLNCPGAEVRKAEWAGKNEGVTGEGVTQGAAAVAEPAEEGA